jgi:ubiquinone/menaquinone biosynthesis C-methylase UbiE
MAAERPVDADAFNAFEAVGWERQAPTYDAFFGRITTRLVDPLLDAASVAAGSRVLDVATGPGYAAAAAAKRGASVVAVDVAPAMVELARRLHPGLDVRQADAETLPFDDRSFDAAVSNFVVPHLGRPERAVAELVRVLTDGGALALTTWDAPDRMRVLGVFLESFAEAGATPPDDLPVGPPFFRFADDATFAGLLGDQGLTDIDVRTVEFTHRVSDADELWNGMLTSTVRTSATFFGQLESTRSAIREAFDRRVVEFERGDQLELPVSAKVASGRRRE